MEPERPYRASLNGLPSRSVYRSSSGAFRKSKAPPCVAARSHSCSFGSSSPTSTIKRTRSPTAAGTGSSRRTRPSSSIVPSTSIGFMFVPSPLRYTAADAAVTRFLSRVHQGDLDVIRLEVRKVAQDLVLGHALRQHLEDVRHADSPFPECKVVRHIGSGQLRCGRAGPYLGIVPCLRLEINQVHLSVVGQFDSIIAAGGRRRIKSWSFLSTTWLHETYSSGRPYGSSTAHDSNFTLAGISSSVATSLSNATIRA